MFGTGDDGWIAPCPDPCAEERNVSAGLLLLVLDHLPLYTAMVPPVEAVLTD